MDSPANDPCVASAQTVRCLRSLADMVDAAAHWRRLDAISTAPLVWFQSFDWCYNWLLHHGDGRIQPMVFVVMEDGEATAILPLMRRAKAFGFSTLEILGEPHTQYANVLTRDGRLPARAAQALGRALSQVQGIDVLHLTLVPEGSALAQVLLHLNSSFSPDNATSLLDLQQFPTVAAYEQKLGKKSSRNLRRAESQLSEIGPLSLVAVRGDDPGFSGHVRRCLDMKEVWLKATGRISLGLDDQCHRRFLATLAGACASPIAFVLKAGERVVAVELGFLQRGHYYAYMGAFAWSLRNLSPGKLQMHMTLRWLLANGVHMIDLLGHPSEYKQRFASHSVALLSGARPYSWRGHMFATLWLRKARPQVKRLFLVLPSPLRFSLNLMRKLEYISIA